MPPVVAIAQNLYLWALTFADGKTRTVTGSSMQTVIGGNFPSPVTSAVRGAPYTTDGAAPTIGSLTPSTYKIGDPNFTLHVLGTGFAPGAVIVFAGIEEPTTYVSPTEVTTLVDMAFWHGPDALPVYVRSIAGVPSNTATFTFTP